VTYRVCVPAHIPARDIRRDQLATIERLLAEYGETKDREVLRLAMALWDEVQAARVRLVMLDRQRTH
jgi:hypothetical protein